jgi:two-component system, response regulator YesN
MYHVLVVDDEPLVRLSLKNMLDWAVHGFFFGYEAAHGQQALDIIQSQAQIDILILDMSMPVMNGLELIERLQFLARRPEILILSAHHDFALVRSAFKLGVHDYVLKAEMEPAIILQHLNEIAARLDASGQQQAAHFPALSPAEKTYLQRQFLKDLLQGQIPRDVTERIHQLDLRLCEASLCVAALSINSFDLVCLRYPPEQLPTFVTNVTNISAQILAKHPYGEVVSLKEEAYALILSAAAPKPDMLPYVDDILREIEQSLRHYLDVSITYGLSDQRHGWACLPQLCQMAMQRQTFESRIVKKAKRYLAEHFHNPDLDLEEISQAIGITKSHLSYQFAKETGEHLRDYLNQVRIAEARKLLLQTNQKVYEVCYAVGYKNVESFSRVFKKLTGVSPNRYSQQD